MRAATGSGRRLLLSRPRPMRILHTFDEETPARVFGDALYVEGIETSLRETRDERWALWVHDETHLERAEALLAEFEANPDAPIFQARRQEAKAHRKAEAEREKKSRHRVMKARETLQRGQQPGYVTLFLVASSVGLFFLTRARPEIANALVPLNGYGVGDVLQRTLFSGQVWRLVTPILLHGGILHLAFNCLWLWDLGRVVERAHGSLRLALMTLVFGVSGIVLQLVWSGALAVGLSGVVYGLLGYLYVRGRYDPTFPYALHRSTMIWMMVWYLFGFTGFFPIANGAHTAGLVLGSAWGFLASGHLTRRSR